MFSLVGKKKLYRETTKQPLSCDVFLPHSVWSFTNWHTVLLFFMLPWHLSCSESTLWNLWLKKKSYIHPCWYVVATRHTAMFWTCVIWWLMLTLSALCLIYLLFYWTIGNRKDCRNSDSGCQYCASMMQRESHTSCRPDLLCPLALWWFICQ